MKKHHEIILSGILTITMVLLLCGFAVSAEVAQPQAAPKAQAPALAPPKAETSTPAPTPAPPAQTPATQQTPPAQAQPDQAAGPETPAPGGPAIPAEMAKHLKGYKPSGFLSDYSQLKPAPDGSQAMSWRKPGLDLKVYDKLLFERINVFYHEDADYKGIDPTELKALIDYFHESALKKLGDAYPIVTEPGPGVLRVRLALTGVVPNKPSVSVVTLVVPYLTIADLGTGTVSKGGAGSNFYVGHTSVEAEFLDGVTNEQVAAYIDRYYPKKYDVELKKGVFGALIHGFGQYFKAYTTWSYTKDAFDYWTQKLRQKLDEAHGKTPAK